MTNAAQIVCKSCDSLVRVPGERLNDGPKCPKCHAPLFDGKPLTLTAANFERHVTGNTLPPPSGAEQWTARSPATTDQQ